MRRTVLISPALNKQVLSLSLLLVAGLTTVVPAHGVYVDALSEMALSNLRFSSPDPFAQLDWIDVWYGEVTALAQDTDSGFAGDFDSQLGIDGGIKAEVHTTHVDSIAEYTVANGDLVAISGGTVDATTQSNLLLTQPNKQADGISVADFDNFFVVTGGAPGTPVEVTFSLDYEGKLKVMADWEGYFLVDLFAGLELLETDAFGFPGLLLDDDFVADFKAGTTMSVDQDHIGTLSVTAELLYDEEYWLFAEGGSAIYGSTVPEPTTLVLIGFGLAGIGYKRYRSRKAT